MRFRVQVVLRTATQARANTQRDWLTAYLAARPSHVVYLAPLAQPDPEGGWRVDCDVSFDLDPDAMQMLSDVEARWVATPQIQTGSYARVHVCRHDETTWPDCVIRDLRVK